MNIINGLTDQPKQQTTIALADGSRVTLRLEYRPNQLAWFYDCTWKNIEIRGQMLSASPNILRQFRSRLPFGLAIITAGNVDPVNIEDFINGTVTVYLLDADDLLDIETVVYPGD